MNKVFYVVFACAVLFFVAAPTFAFYYPFGGLIVSPIILPPAPFGPCLLPSIIVGPPNPGIFMVPPGLLYPFWDLLPGRNVLGLATSPVCGVIYFVGTS